MRPFPIAHGSLNPFSCFLANTLRFPPFSSAVSSRSISGDHRERVHRLLRPILTFTVPFSRFLLPIAWLYDSGLSISLEELAVGRWTSVQFLLETDGRDELLGHLEETNIDLLPGLIDFPGFDPDYYSRASPACSMDGRPNSILAEDGAPSRRGGCRSPIRSAAHG
jgi:hypothetical protein